MTPEPLAYLDATTAAARADERHRALGYDPCGLCGRPVRPSRRTRRGPKCDGWYWHERCWRNFLDA